MSFVLVGIDLLFFVTINLLLYNIFITFNFVHYVEILYLDLVITMSVIIFAPLYFFCTLFLLKSCACQTKVLRRRII